MGHYDLQYPKETFSTVKRYDSRASYALRTIHQLINSAQLLHVSFNTPHTTPFPMILPMIGQMGSFARPSADEGDVLDLYLHGYVSSRLMNLTRQENKSNSDGATEDDSKGFPVTVAASHVDGLVLALTPNSHSYNYRSAVLFGHASLVEDEEEKVYAMRLMTNGVVPGRWEGSRVPPNKAEMQSTSVLKVTISNGSAKIRSGGPHDDRCDLNDEGVLDRVWTGVVPVHTTLGAPVPGDYNRIKETPAYVADFVKDFNEAARDQALEAIKEPKAE